jgi:hypothetical protein
VNARFQKVINRSSEAEINAQIIISQAGKNAKG